MLFFQKSKKQPFSAPKSSSVFLRRRFFLACREERHAMMRIFRAHQFIKGISHCYRPKTASADGIYCAIRVRAMEEFTHRQHQFTPIRPECKVLRGLRLLLTLVTEQLIRQSFESRG
jgi:hypothetical protein